MPSLYIGRRVTILVAALLTVACTGDGTGDGTGSAAANAAPTFARLDPGAVAGGPGPSARFALGTAVSPARVAEWDFDIAPDGTGLPAGSGTAARGQTLYAAQCASCHGAQGEGKAPNPALIGRPPAAEGFKFATDPALVHTIGNYWSHATSLFDYIKRAMPLSAPGSLSNDEVYALTAYLLAANEVIPMTATLDAVSLRAVKMPYADRFVPDTRRGGPEVR